MTQNSIFENAHHLLDDDIDLTKNKEGDLSNGNNITEPINQEPEPTQTEPSKNSNVSAVYQFLMQKGIEDPSKIKYETEDNNIEDIDFNTLSPEEQLTILNEVSNSDLSEHELGVVNYLRNNNATLEEVIDYFSEKRLQEYLTENPDKVHQTIYSIDDYSDDEIYMADLKSKYTSFTDEELAAKLEIAKSNEDLFKKEVDVLRDNYKAEEDNAKEAEKVRQDQEYQDLRNNLVEAVENFNEVSLDYTDPKSDSLVIEDNDKNQILSYLLNQDSDGKSQFVKDIEDPQTLIQLAWFRIHGQEVLSGITKYWKDILKSERKDLSDLKKENTSLKEKGNNTFIEPKKNEDSKVPSLNSIWGNSFN